MIPCNQYLGWNGARKSQVPCLAVAMHYHLLKIVTRVFVDIGSMEMRVSYFTILKRSWPLMVWYCSIFTCKIKVINLSLVRCDSNRQWTCKNKYCCHVWYPGLSSDMKYNLLLNMLAAYHSLCLIWWNHSAISHEWMFNVSNYWALNFHLLIFITVSACSSVYCNFVVLYNKKIIFMIVSAVFTLFKHVFHADTSVFFLKQFTRIFLLCTMRFPLKSILKGR